MPLFLVLDALLLASELFLVWRRRSSGSPTAATPLDRSSLRILWVGIASAITAGHFAAVRGAGPLLALGAARPWVAGALFAAGALLRWRSIVHLGRFFTVDVAIAGDHRVVDDGPYRWVRHPSYTGLLLECTGLGVSLGRWSSLMFILVPIFLVLRMRIQVEEQALRENLGESYAAYARRTKRLIPGVY